MTEATDLAKALFAALDAEDWTGAACLFNPVQVEEWYRAFLQRRPTQQDFSLTVDQYLKHSPDMPREVAEYQVAQMRRNHLSRMSKVFVNIGTQPRWLHGTGRNDHGQA
jgi:hypothetical protein